MAEPRALLPQVVRDLQELGRPFALVGGLAVSVRAEERFTKDIDFAVSVPNEAAFKATLRDLIKQKHYKAEEPFQDARTGELRGARLSPPGQEGAAVPVDLLFRTCGIEREVVAAAEPVEVFPGTTVNVATCGHLIAMKTLSLDDARRLKDRVDIAALLKSADGKDLAQAQAAVDLMQARGYGFALGKDDLRHELEQARQLYAPELKPEVTAAQAQGIKLQQEI